MTKLKLFFILIFGIQISLSAQWTLKNVNSLTTLQSVNFQDDNLGFVVGGNDIYKTTNGGDNWEICFMASDLAIFEDIVIIKEEKIIAVGFNADLNQAVMVKSDDNGVNWKDINVPSVALLKSVFFPNPNTGYCVGGGGALLKSTDAGESWQALNSGTNLNLQSIFFVNDLVGIAVGGMSGTSLILKTVDGGDSWQEIPAPSNNYLQSIFLINQEIGYTVGWNGEIMKTEDCGDTWESQIAVEMYGNLEVVFTDDQTGYIVGGQQFETMVLKTVNGGESWENISPLFNEGLISVSFPSFNVGYAVGTKGTVLKTESGGVISNLEILTSEELLIYPNPIQNQLWVESKGIDLINELKVYDANGRLIKETKAFGSKVEIDFSDLMPDVYYLLIKADGFETVRKLVKI